jgi:S-adenosylmethionine synthetase
MLSITTRSHTTLSEHFERTSSRNAKAQARHRAKRKAYIDQVSPRVLQLVHSRHDHATTQQLEQTVTKLQIVVGYTKERVSALAPSPLLLKYESSTRIMQDYRKKMMSSVDYFN